MTPTRRTPTMRIADIQIGERFRRDFGDLKPMAQNIAEIGVLQPVGVTPDKTLIFGARRLRAAEAAGLAEVPVTVIDLDDIAQCEYAENTYRKDFTPSEIVAIKRALEPQLAAKAKERMSVGGKGGEIPHPSRGRAADKVAVFVGKDRRTVEKAEAVVAAAEANPAKFGELVEQMDRTGKVNGPYRRLQVAVQAEQIRVEPPPLPGNGPYRVATCDVPWPSEPDDPDPSRRAYWPFPTLSISEICALAVGSIMHDDSILWFWTTNFHMRLAYTVLEAWGFHDTPTILTWAKDRPGRGQRLLGQTEHCIMAVRGKPLVTLKNQTTLLQAPVGKPLGRKPPEFYDLVESLCPAPRYADLFSRNKHNGRWDCHGDEAPPQKPYDAADDFSESINEAYRAVRERVAAGGPSWTPRDPQPPLSDMPDIAPSLRRTR
jgi:N6-adenosine-specific RNA methylase IME4